MQDNQKTKERLVEELAEMRQRVSAMEATEARLLETEKALRESEERFRLLYENAPLGYQSLDENGHFLEINQAWLHTLGYSREEVVGKWFGNFLAPGYQEHFKANFPKFKAAGEIHGVEFEMLRKDGSQIAVAFDGQIARDEQGRFRQTHCILHDITERKRAEEEIKGSEARVRMKLDSILSPEGDIGTLELADVIDARAIQALMDDFFNLTNIGVGIIDRRGEVLVATGWQEICIKFHRAHPETCKHCVESDTELSVSTEQGFFKHYRCKNNMWDIATPIIVGGKHLGNIFLGQFLFEDETPDFETFRFQARQYGFDEEEYLAALDKVPRWSRQTVDTVMAFYSKLAGILSTLSYSNIKLARSLAEEQRLLSSLRDSQQRYKAVVDNVGIGISLINASMEIVEVNRAFREYFPHVRPASGQICHEQYNDPPRSEPCSYCPCVLTFQDGETHEAITETPEGSEIRYYHVVSSPIKDSEGRVQYVIQLSEDITERKKAQESLNRANQEWEQTFNAISDFVMVLDDEHKILRANKAMADALGTTERDLIGKRCFELVHGEQEPPPFCPHSQLIADGEEHSAEVVEPRLGGIYDVRVSPLVDQNGQVIGSVHVTRDITERKKAEAALRKSEERYRLLVDLAPDAIVVSQDGRITYINRAAAQLLDETDIGQVVGTRPLEWVHPDDRALVTHRMQVLLAAETSVPHAAWRLLRRDGTVRDVEAVSGSLRSGESMIIHAMLRDITDRKRIENIMLARLRLVEYATSHSLEELLQTTLDEVEALTDSSIGFYHFLEADQRTLRLQAWSTRTLRNCSAGGKGLHYDIDQAGVWVDCIHERRPVIHNDFHALPHRKGMPAGHAEVIREVVVPVFRGDRIVAILGVGNKPVDYGESDIETVSLLADLACDITERKMAEEALRAASLYNRSLIEASLDPLVTVSVEGKITDVNRATERVTGFSRDELIGTDFADYFSDPQKARDGYKRAFKEGVVKDYELEIRHREGNFTSVMYNASVYCDSSGEIVGLFAAARDISRSKQAEEKNLRLAAIVESSDDAIIGKTLDGIITSWNKGAANIYGYRDAEVVGKPISVLVPPDRQDEIPQLLERMKRGEHVEHFETVRLKEDASRIDVSLTISPVRNAEGRIIGASTIARDITEQKSLQRQLLQAQKMESIGTLAGGIAHDFNNLLTVVLGYSELLLIRKDERDPLHTDLKKINQAARSGAELVQRILAFSRKTEINPRSLNLNHEIEQVKTLLARTIPKMIEIELALSDELAMVNADPVQIEQVLMNLAVNARDAMQDGGKLTIGTKNVALDEAYCRMHLGAKPGDYVMLSVSDTGHGMEKETLNRVFEPFYTTKGVGRGTGLGLAMVYGIVKQHGGYIICYSEPEIGTTFKIYLPVIPSEAKLETTTRKAVPQKGTETILLVDDEEFVRELGKRILEQSGYTVLAADNGKQALDLYKRARDTISLVILDLIMPEMGGKECLQELLEIDPQVKVLVTSGFTADGQTKEAIETGAKGLVGKPYNLDALLHAVREVLDSD